jgi:stress response protein YsnF
MVPTMIASVENQDRVGELLEKLRTKLKKYTALTRSSQIIGEIKDLILDSDRNLYLVVQVAHNQRFFLLGSKLIQKIDPPTQSVILEISESELKNMPEYLDTEINNKDIVHPNPEIMPDGVAVIADAIEPHNQATTTEVTEDIIRLLGERLVVDRSKRKIGDVIVRKEIETYMIQVPVRREKLIIEQVSPEHKQLAEIDLGQEELTDITLAEVQSVSQNTRPLSGITVSGEFDSPKIASLLLNAIAMERSSGTKKIRIEIVVEDESRQKTYQEWFDRCSKGQKPPAV